MASSVRVRGKQQNAAARSKENWWKKITNLWREFSLLKFLSDSNSAWLITFLLLFLEIFVTVAVIEKIPYTEIDWKAYMQEVEGVVNGTFDYEKLKGDTGPLVYPAGFVYVFFVLYFLTERGLNIYFAQYIFAVLYLATLYFVFRLYKKTSVVPPYALIFMCCTSYRIHSIYVLRLFNDPVAIFFLFLAINCFVSNRWTAGCILYSFAVSIKMNILLFAPGLLFLLLCSHRLSGVAIQLTLCGIVQILVGLPFLLVNPLSYISRAFNIGRIFLYQWTVNWRLLPEEIFLNRYFHFALLFLHVAVLCLFFYRWKKGLYVHAIHHHYHETPLCADYILLVLFTSNFIGMIFCRSLHYQFYVWYFFTLPYLLWSTSYNPIVKLCILGVLELAWNTYPSTALSSFLMHLCHLLILSSLYLNRPFMKTKDVKEKER